MKPDEEYEDVDDSKIGTNSRAMSWMVLAVAVGGFAALAFYAYNSGTDAPKDGDTMVVEADEAPIKTAPEVADGEQFPNKDKTIYDVIAPDGQKNVEKLMPEPERPVVANVEDSEDNAPVATPPAAALAAVAKPEAPTAAPKPAPAPVAAAPAPTVAPAPAPAPAPAAPAPVAAAPAPTTTTYVAADQKPAEPAPAQAAKPSFESPQMINEKPKPKAAPVAAKGGAYMIQLGAFKSEAEAKTSWNKIATKHGLTSAPTIVKADVKGTTFYRLRTGSYASSADAKAACAKLGGQVCMPVK